MSIKPQPIHDNRCAKHALSAKEKKSFQKCVRRFLHLVAKGEREDFDSFYAEIWDATCISSVFLDSNLKQKFAVRAFEFLSDHLDLLPHLGDSDNACVALSEYLLTLLEQLHRCFMMYFDTMKITPGDDYPVKGYIPFILSGDVHKLLKYQTCVFWNIHLDSSEEEYPKAGVFEGLPLFFGNKNGKVFLNRNKRNTFIHYSTFQGFKKCLPPLPLPKVWEAFNDLESDLTAEPGPFSEKRIRRYVDQMTRGTKCSKPALSYSFGASYFSNRKAGGQLGELLDMYKTERNRADPSIRAYEITPVLRGWVLNCNRLESCYSEGPSWEGLTDFWFRRISFGSPASLMKYTPAAHAIPLGILEPLKVRIITKGDAMTLCGLHHVKNDLRRVLRKTPNGIFDLCFDSLDSSWNWETKEFWRKSAADCGSMIDLKLWDSRILDGSVPATVTGKTYWCSGDYSAATNKCNGEVSAYILNRFCSNLGYDAEIAWRANRSLLGNQMLFDPRTVIPWNAYGFEKPEREDFAQRIYTQKNGQLMGSVISFPILCMMNLFAYWHAVEDYTGRILSLFELCSQYPLRINGDDILFPCNKSFYDTWSQTISKYGFEKSQGKNLLLEDKFTINSVYYVQDTKEPSKITAVPYLNFGFLNGVKKGDGTRDTVSRATQKGPDFITSVHSRDFWTSAAQGFSALKKLPNGYKERSIEAFYGTYDPYLRTQGVDREFWEESYSLMERTTSDEVVESHFPHRKDDADPEEFRLRRAVKRVRQDVCSKGGCEAPVKLECQKIGMSTHIEWSHEDIFKSGTTRWASAAKDLVNQDWDLYLANARSAPA